MALDTTYTSATYNAYSSLEDMNAAMTEFGLLSDNTFWSSLTDPDKEGLIKLATKEINNHEWTGTQNTGIVVVSMDWPRTGIDNVEDTEIPSEIIERMACWISHNAKQSTLNTTGSINSKSVGEVSVSYNSSSVGSVNQSDPCSSYASQYLERSSKTSFGGVGSISKRRGP